MLGARLLKTSVADAAVATSALFVRERNMLFVRAPGKKTGGQQNCKALFNELRAGETARFDPGTYSVNTKRFSGAPLAYCM